MFRERRFEEGKRAGFRNQGLNRSWSGRRVGGPRRGAELQLRFANRGSLRKQRGELPLVQLTKAAKIIDAREAVDANQAQFGCAVLALGKPIEQIDKMHLTKQVVLKPAHYLFMISKLRQRLFLPPQFPDALVGINAVRFGQMLRTQ